MSRLYYAASLLMMLAPLNAHAEGQLPWLPSILSDHMVVQQGQPIPVWGRDLPGSAIRVEMAGQHAESKAGSDGSWSVKLPKLAAGGPYELSVAGSATRTVQDVLVGELWLGAGQSNMELAMRVTKDRDSQIPAASDGHLRLFTAERVASFKPEEDLRGAWQVCSPESVKDFSAVAYHFAHSLRASLKRPVGMIVSSWGGTPAEDWMPRAALEKEPVLKNLLAQWDADADRQSLWKEGQPFELVLSDIHLVPKDPKAPLLKITIDPAGPKELGGRWGHSEKFDSQGNFEAVTDEAGTAGRYSGRMRGGAWGSVQCALASAPVDLTAYQAVEFMAKGKGQFVPTLGQPSITDYDYYAGEPFKLSDDWRSLRVPLDKLKQGGWGEHKDFTPAALSSLNFGIQVPYWPDLGALAFNGMVHPLRALPLRGVIWYQGEGNAGRAAQYKAVLSGLIGSWRAAFQQPKLPFYIVQLPGWAEAGGSWPPLREAQREVSLSVEHAGLVSTLDLGESHDIHPKDKRPVGERLAALALADVYGVPSGPLTPFLTTATTKGAEVTLRFEQAPQGLLLKGGGGFDLAGPDDIFHPASAVLTKDGVTLSSPEVRQPKEARHAWSDDPQAYASAKDGLPLPTFAVTLP